MEVTAPGGSSHLGSLGMRMPRPLQDPLARLSAARSSMISSMLGESSTVISHRSSPLPVIHRRVCWRFTSLGGRCSKHMRRMSRLAASHCSAHSQVSGKMASGRPQGALSRVKPHMAAHAGNAGWPQPGPLRWGAQLHSPRARLQVPFVPQPPGHGFSTYRPARPSCGAGLKAPGAVPTAGMATLRAGVGSALAAGIFAREEILLCALIN
mmetsp:Transcript_7152/g.24387  ORF Transcript_7152/g.24387 Transcript_7152/m.24387 type:complete len:210 (+) Transcript_7152:1493-2122(+)